MSKYKILFKLSGSIAAYKSAFLISKLVQNNCEVQTVASEAALHFIGKATLEGLTAKPVVTDTFADGEMMSHIILVKWADLTILVPASANTINKYAAGIGDNILTSLFLAHDWKTPYLIAPAMNTWMYQHPATMASLKKLKDWGVEVLPTDEGYLACGDMGKGKLLNPDDIYQIIIQKLEANKTEHQYRLKVLITAGGTREKIDNIRYISNLSTGKTSSTIAQYFLDRGHELTYIHSIDAKLPEGIFETIEYFDFNDLNEKIKAALKENNYDAVIHQAAISDFSLDSIQADDKILYTPLKEKLNSDVQNLTFNLRPNFKIINRIKKYADDKKIKVVSFKFTDTDDKDSQIEQINKLFEKSNSDYVVHNDYSGRIKQNSQNNFTIYNKEGKITNVETAKDLAEELETLLIKKKK
ncbi:MAG: bifunctional phosphopantothenoylcysteine decarboxylase/phosphopantothenate--cysteine ligase CoaBC [Ignavibacteria bacterium]|jgi:phosphopantothenoylcysteine decarboxylase/phosphopantothenate--cysteine ligase